MIELWEKELTKYGFAHEVGVNGKISYVRKKGAIRMHIWEEYSKTEKGTRVGTFIEAVDQFRDVDDVRIVTLLGGCLSVNSVILPSRGQGSGRYWKTEEENEALTALLQHGMLWFDQYGDVRTLIEIFESELRDGVRPVRRRRSLLTRIAERVLMRQDRAPKAPVPRRPPINHYFLSLLYYAVGDMDNACAHAKEHLVFCQTKIKLSGEPDRTIRQIAAMKCPSYEPRKT